jgi:hypothetical protein
VISTNAFAHHSGTAFAIAACGSSNRFFQAMPAATDLVYHYYPAYSVELLVGFRYLANALPLDLFFVQ